MARLHEYHGKAILAANGFKILQFGVGAEAEEDFAGVVHTHVVVPYREVFGPAVAGSSAPCPTGRA